METRLCQIFEIDQLLFNYVRLPISEVPSWTITPEKQLKDHFLVEKPKPLGELISVELTEEEPEEKDWTVLKSATNALYPLDPDKPGFQEWTVPGTTFKYSIHSGDDFPSFTFFPRGREIMHRLIVRAIFTEFVDELDLKLSCL